MGVLNVKIQITAKGKYKLDVTVYHMEYMKGKTVVKSRRSIYVLIYLSRYLHFNNSISWYNIDTRIVSISGIHFKYSIKGFLLEHQGQIDNDNRL